MNLQLTVYVAEIKSSQLQYLPQKLITLATAQKLIMLFMLCYVIFCLMHQKICLLFIGSGQMHVKNVLVFSLLLCVNK